MIDGETVIDCVVSPPGDHKNVPPEVDGFAVKTVLDPLQIVALLTVTEEEEVTVMFWVVVLQPIELHA